MGRSTMIAFDFGPAFSRIVEAPACIQGES